VADDAEVVRAFTRVLADALAHVACDSLVGVYLHGSAVLGDWSPDTSDVDLLVIVGSGVTSIVAERLAAVLAGDRDCPGVGLEASIVEADAAAAPAAPWPFVVHVTTALRDRKTLWGPLRSATSI
jgi:streptomycin 3"-adenylyltransferase